ncbi:DegT/DnrJ/EryC1/StrS family aminotransferase [Paraburkholderia caballeronis]|uniref:dTDP-4-amino-4,6-dideoxygalactose transaminase n=1 Tax=Paraburkholderia caballeronis TaxID=416943 RepID=A0A1H7F6M8_9BURK|nr:DegT/DnrJ/EryC1/StrS family aminotransferase [Paraburkholderia caballeronis]PXW23998.1 dTDP-4-amino-4,6-dideoxygalactose transaminase [Paraburkholderia caballeronis]PXW99762.1 dTDP-4-amino-4,6-dideoxygalactose transaminase [Paraburkholderia caballeronis]RAJ96716.1 dTDP-4-amino-4,6-dideoxygalactose transaminase [Paraburkholderia caballeronis]TDV15748.1 dTDP-4-amino-4,6-dideoxygalactose transaminase [Paraburkholderia caballeronis]TDV18003.1 dTDP-4-amino-4,6-dideoxygalactose transaminase [Para
MEIDEIALSEPACGAREIELVNAVLQSSRWSDGPMVGSFETAFAGWSGRAHAVAVASGTLGAWIALRALGLGAGDEVICASHTWHQIAQAVTLAGARPVFADIDYWSGCLSAAKAEQKIGPRTRAILAGNTNGHPAAWGPLRALADAHGLTLIEDSTEALGSRYRGRSVGSFGDVSVFDFSAPSALCAGEGGMLVTDDERLAHELRYLRQRRIADRESVSVGSRVPLQAGMSELTAALGLAQLAGLDERLAQRRQVEAWYRDAMQSFEGIKPPYLAEDVEEVHWMLYVVHLGKRFTQSARAQMIDDMKACGIETAAYSHPLHEQFHYMNSGDAIGRRRGTLPDTERIGDRALALPLHTQLDAGQVGYIVKTLKDTATNVGAGAAIYL